MDHVGALTAALETNSPDETFALGAALGEVLEPRDFVGLSGQLGAGKTLFSRGVAQGAGAPLEDVSSPTYSIVQSYRGRVVLHHADLYRLSSDDELYATGYYELLEGEGAALVEWVEQVPGAAPADALLLRIEVSGEECRRMTATATGPRAAALLRRWQARRGGSPARGD
jgi:tRNA threonylcarbamoyladenosine biosynthesis protein TsaE